MAAEHKGNEVKVLQLQPQPVLSIRATFRVDQLGEAMADSIQALSAYLRQSGAQPIGPPFARYHTFGETETDLEVGVPVIEPVAGEGRVAAGELPGGPAVMTWHSGPHDKLGDAYARINAWLKEHVREPDGPAWDICHWIELSQNSGPLTWDPSTWHTQLVQPAK